MFYEYLDKHDLRDVLNPVDYVAPDFINLNRVFDFLQDIVQNNKRVLIYGDYDVDGAMCILSIRDSLRSIGFTNYTIFKYVARTHDLDKYAVHQCIRNHYDYMIIADTGSSDLNEINRLVAAGVKIILLDHHNTIYSYEDFPEEVAMINTTLENFSLGHDVFKLSAGALCYCVMERFIREYYHAENKSTVAYALTSLYADHMDMANVLNRSIYWKAIVLSKSELPPYLQHFMNEYTVFGRRYIEFWFSPRINALFRAEHFALLNAYLFGSNDAVTTAKYVQFINDLYEKNRTMVLKVSDLLQSKVEVLNNFVLCDLYAVNEYVPVLENKLYNYTGLIANKLAEQFKTAAIVYCETPEYFKGSVRDKYNRNYLPLFKQLTYAGGHNSAFGLKINLLEFNKFHENLYRVDKYYAEKIKHDGVIIEEYQALEPDPTLIENMALYNDFAGNELPTAFIKKQLLGNMTEQYGTFYHTYNWGLYKIQSQASLDFGSMLIMKPTKKKNTVLVV